MLSWQIDGWSVTELKDHTAKYEHRDDNQLEKMWLVRQHIKEQQEKKQT